MTDAANYLLEHLQVRKSADQKANFRKWVIRVLKDAGYDPRVESGGILVKSNNVVVGDVERADVIFTAHYDTCSVLPISNFITPQNMLIYLLYQVLICVPMFALAIAAEVLLLTLWPDCPMWLALFVIYAVLGFCIWWLYFGPANKHTANDNTSGVATLLEILLSLPEGMRSNAVFVFFDNEEKGLLGSKQFKKVHGKLLKDALLINFDCVSDGDYIQFYPSAKQKKEKSVLLDLENAFQSSNSKTVQIVRGFGFYPSDQKSFPGGVGVAALHKSWFGYWLGRIHTRRDKVFQTENIELLRAGALRLMELKKQAAQNS